MRSQLVSTPAVINIAVYLQIRRARPTARSRDDDGDDDDDDAESFIDRTSRCSRGQCVRRFALLCCSPG